MWRICHSVARLPLEPHRDISWGRDISQIVIGIIFNFVVVALVALFWPRKDDK
ncbi:MAG TPA: hypothetical protein VJZ77_05745 [Blastocatellia bacterium]|nr:hypothetical protein [Blastocatellia bacterium]